MKVLDQLREEWRRRSCVYLTIFDRPKKFGAAIRYDKAGQVTAPDKV